MGTDPRHHLSCLATVDSMPQGRKAPSGTQLISGRAPLKQELLLSSAMLFL